MPESISVLIPVYNRARYILECIESIKKQTYGAVKILVYDDGSSDDTLQILRCCDGIELYEGGINRGVSYARNYLLSCCNTRYGAWQDSDDISNVFRLSQQMEVLKQAEAPGVFCNWKYFFNSPVDGAEQLPETDPSNYTHCLGGSLFDLSKTGNTLFDERIDLGGEDLIWLKRLAHESGSFTWCNKTLYYVRKHNQRISTLKARSENAERRRTSDRAYAEALERMKL